MYFVNRLACSALLLATVACRAAADATNADAVTPVAAAVLDALAAKRAGLQTLTWRLSGAGNFDAIGCYLRGQGVKLTTTSMFGEENTEVYFLSGRCLTIYQQAGRHDKAAAFAEQLLTTSNATAQALDAAGRYFQSTGELPKAMAACRRALSLEMSADMRANRQIALLQLCLQNDRTDEAGAILGELQQQDLAGAVYLRAELDRLQMEYLRKTGKMEEFLTTTAAELAKSPTNAVLLARLAAAYLNANRSGESIAIYQRLLAVRPDDATCMELSRCLIRNPRGKETLALYEACLTNSPKFRKTGGVLQQYVSLCCSAGEPDRASAFVRRYPEEPSRDPQIWQTMGTALREAGRLDESIAVFTNAIAQANDPYARDQGRVGLASVYAKQGKYAEAEAILRPMAAATNANNYAAQLARRELINVLRGSGGLDAYFAELKGKSGATDKAALETQAQALYEAQSYVDAAEVYEKLTRLNPKSQNYWQMRISALESADQPQTLLKAYEAAFTNVPTMRSSYLQNYIYACQQAGQLDRALTAVRNLPLNDRNAAGAWSALGGALGSADRWPEAIAMFSNAVTHAADANSRDQYRLQLATTYARADNAAIAESLLTDLSRSNRTGVVAQQARRELVSLLRKSGRADAYIATLKASAGPTPGKEDLSLLAQVTSEAGDHAAAAGYSAKLAQIDPSFEHDLAWSRELAAQQQYDAAIDLLEKCMLRYPEQNRQCWYDLRSVCQRARKPDRAIAIIRAFAEKKATDADAWSQLAELVQQDKRWDEAAQTYAKAEELATNDTQRRELHFQRGTLLERQEKWPEAEKLFGELLRTADDNTRSRVQRELLTIRQKTGTLNSYIADLDRTVQQKPADKATLALLVDACETSGQREGAARASGMLVKLDPSENNFERWINALASAQAHTNLVAAYEEFFRKFPARRNEQYLWGFAQSLQQTGNTSNAVAVARECVEKSRNRRYAYQQLAEFCHTAGRIDEALAAWDKAIALAPSAAEKRNAAMGKIRLLSSCNRDKEAREALRQLQQDSAADENDGDQMTWLLIETLQKSNELQAYLQELEKKPADKQTPSDLTLLGIGYQRIPDHAKSVAAYRRLFERQPTENHAFCLVNALSYANDYPAVVVACQEMLRRFPDRKARFLGNLMQAQQQLQHYDEAIAAGEETLRLEPGATHLYRQLAQICRTTKRYDQAIAYYQKLLTGTGAAQAADNRPHYQLELADVLLEAGQPEAAQKQVDAVIAAKPETRLLERATELSNRILRQTGKWEAHIKELEQQNLKSTNAVVLLQLAAAYAEKNDLTAAAGVYARLVDLDPAVNYYEKWIDTLGQLKAYARQIEAIHTLWAKHPEYKQSYLNALETAYTETGNFDKAIETVKEIERVTGNSNEGYANQHIAQLLHKAGRTSEAVPFLEKAVQLSTSYQRSQCAVELLALCKELGDDDKLEKALVMALPWLGDPKTSFYGHDDKLKTALKTVCERHANFAEEYWHAADAHPDDLQAQSVSELLCQLLDQKEDAEHYRQRSLDILAHAADAAPDNYEAQMKVGQFCIRQQDRSRAIPYLERALTLQTNEACCEQLAHAYESCKLYDKEIVLLQATIDKFPNNTAYRYSRLAQAYLAAGQPDKALATAKKVADMDPGNPARKNLLVDFYAQLGKLEEAIATYRAMREEAGAKTVPSYQRQQIDNAAVAIATKSKESPAKLLVFLRSVRADITDGKAKQTIDRQIAQLTAPAGNPDTPPDNGQGDIQQFEAAAAENPQNPVPLINLAATYRRLGDRAREAATLRRVLAVDCNPKNYLALIACLAATGDDKGVVATYEALLAARPATAPAHAANYVSAAGRAGMLDAVADKWAAVLAKMPGDRTAIAVQTAVQNVRDRLRSPGRKVADAAQPDVTWFVPEKGFPIRMEKGAQDDFYAFAAGMNLLQVRTTGLAIAGKQAWLATERGAFQFDQEHRHWEEIGLDAAYLGKPVESVATNATGRVVFTAVIEGKKTGFVLDPTTERWSKP
jgi:tetratricopeptide (TPR) repeat protein